ncbi:MAG: hypothetical protein FJW34_00125 [Acidobacteria bacterium]|nr:hypothetical protein [Acidobacteriota bacterium]
MTAEQIRDLGLANGSRWCVHCFGLGVVRFGRPGAADFCRCVLRRVFRSVWNRYEYARDIGFWNGRLTIELIKRGGMVAGHKDAEFAADVVLIARRELDDFHFQVFKAHFLDRLEWRDSVRVLARFVHIARMAGSHDLPAIDRGNFFHAVYRLEAKLGRAFLTTAPYALFPTREYYNGKAISLSQIPQGASHARKRRNNGLAIGAAA